jgi:hypothetical protein
LPSGTRLWIRIKTVGIIKKAVSQKPLGNNSVKGSSHLNLGTGVGLVLEELFEELFTGVF